MPDSLHALFAARLDALDPGVRPLVADAAVLGTTFSAEALITVSGQEEAVIRAAPERRDPCAATGVWPAWLTDARCPGLDQAAGPGFPDPGSRIIAHIGGDDPAWMTSMTLNP